uniref:ZP domain-containing protein n=1 Tax=Nothobranchius kadleci TaxID=1051664 RepID=A0A1A8D1G1_NOTKA
MEAGVILLLLSSLLGRSWTLSFYGDSISVMPLQKNSDGTLKVTFYHRQNGRSDCQNQTSFFCEGGTCSDFVQSEVLQMDWDDSDQGRWCQSEGLTTETVQPNRTTFTLRESGCCWMSNVEGKTSWTSRVDLDLGTRSDSLNLNSCPVSTTVPSLRIPQNCFTRIRLLAHDPDGDVVRCRFTSEASVPANFTLDQSACTLGNAGTVQSGVHVFELLLEDFPSSNISLTYSDGTSASRGTFNTNSPPLCSVMLQFSVEVLPPISTCVAGSMLPMFLSRTPSHGEVLHASPGQTFQLYAQAQAQNSQIRSFQVSGPGNMTREFSTDLTGKAEVILSWTPQWRDLKRLVPVCFTAETTQTQSEMRCVVVMVTRAISTQGNATVTCSPNKMTVMLEKASMPDIDEHYLKLKDPSCSLVSNDTYIMGTMSFSTCGTTLEDKGDYIVFKNEIHSFERPTEVITRRKTVQIDFSCEFPKTVTISSYYNLHQSDYIFTESNFGSFGYTFEIFRDGNFTQKVASDAYPVQVKLMETIYMGIQANSELPSVSLFVESCKATPDENPKNSLFYYLIQNGCLKDETVKIHPSNQTSFNFELQAFKFNGEFDQVTKKSSEFQNGRIKYGRSAVPASLDKITGV